MNIDQVIATKAHGQALSKAQINALTEQIASSHMSDRQLAEFASAIYARGMNIDEIINLTRAMSHSGHCFSWQVNGPVVDKHSSGGVGDLVSLILAPLLAACGCYVPMISGKALGHTGGTVDKLQSIPGYNVQPDKQRFIKCVESVGAAIIAQSHWCAPADARLYAMRNQTDTVDSLPLIVSSILSKKMAEGLDALVLDIKVGSGAWFATQQDAEPLQRALLDVSQALGIKASACLTDMNSPISFAVGNGLEVKEAIDFLTNKKRHPAMLSLVRQLAVKTLLLAGQYACEKRALELVTRVLASGVAAERFAQMVSALGGPADLLERPARYLKAAPVVKPVLSPINGRIVHYDMKRLGQICQQLSCTDTHPDARVGLSELAPLTIQVTQGAPLAIVHASSENDWHKASQQFLSTCIHIAKHEEHVPDRLVKRNGGRVEV